MVVFGVMVVVVVVIAFMVVVIVTAVVLLAVVIWNSLSKCMFGGGIWCAVSGSCGNNVCFGSYLFHQPHRCHYHQLNHNPHHYN